MLFSSVVTPWQVIGSIAQSSECNRACGKHAVFRQKWLPHPCWRLMSQANGHPNVFLPTNATCGTSRSCPRLERKCSLSSWFSRNFLLSVANQSSGFRSGLKPNHPGHDRRILASWRLFPKGGMLCNTSVGKKMIQCPCGKMSVWLYIETQLRGMTGTALLQNILMKNITFHLYNLEALKWWSPAKEAFWICLNLPPLFPGGMKEEFSINEFLFWNLNMSYLCVVVLFSIALTDFLSFSLWIKYVLKTSFWGIVQLGK